MRERALSGDRGNAAGAVRGRGLRADCCTGEKGPELCGERGGGSAGAAAAGPAAGRSSLVFVSGASALGGRTGARPRREPR